MDQSDGKWATINVYRYIYVLYMSYVMSIHNINHYQFIFPSKALSRKDELVNRSYKHIIIRIMQRFHSLSN